MIVDREPPKRTINKLDAIRHLLHASIRMHFAEEDPFANHLLIQSTDKLIRDYAKKKRVSTALNWSDKLRPERSDEFFAIYRETYNYFKHANKDAEKELGVRDPVGMNEISLMLNVLAAKDLGVPFSHHMHAFLAFMRLCYDNIDNMLSIPWTEDTTKLRNHFRAHTRGELLSLMRDELQRSSEAQSERERDLIDMLAVKNSRGK